MTATNSPLRTIHARASAAEPMTMAFEVQVTAVQQLTPTFRRITFGGYSLRDFGVHGNTLDLRIKLMIPSLAKDGHPLPLPEFRTEQAGWYQDWLGQDPSVRGSMRTYTVRRERLDAVYPEIDVDFALHGDHTGHGGPAADWALRASPGDTLKLIGPNNRAAHCVTAEQYSGIEWRPGLAQRVLLAGDETAVPAISAILESLPPYMSGQAILEVPESGDFQDVMTAADVEISWLARSTAAGGPVPHGRLLQEAVRAAVPLPGWVGRKTTERVAGPEPEDVDVDQHVLWETPARMDTAAIAAGRNPDTPAGVAPFYAWIAGEAGVIKEMRRYLVRDVGIDRKQVAFMGYWRQGKAEL
ncbi:iron complex transport system ATP-binding protein [Arthrobacter sp. B3I9]|uniref:siderophore-interacting protein n=1 Tax=Arthrobacter sp. B3I9 TaxID=3042270 RepID=UPI00278D8F86|nr:siderophore-interacting protein [Arthrobacter sp. B3I9]MDQ0848538.1 iron complex transport system ATP-binding protein [Arthrobacter sp. B3I9]